MDTNTDRIIGDFLEINADIISKEFKSKLPKFISKIHYNKYKKRLIKSATNLKNSNMILTKENLEELFSYCYNNYPPNGSYRSINKVMYNQDTGKYEGIIKFDNITAIIDIEKNYDGFTIGVKEKNIESGEWNNFSIHCIRLDTKNNAALDTIKNINKQLLEDISNFILDIINK